MKGSVIRFLVEAAFIVLIAAAAAIAHLGKLWIALAVGAAWVLVALVERSVQADDSRLRDGLNTGQCDAAARLGLGATLAFCDCDVQLGRGHVVEQNDVRPGGVGVRRRQ